MEAAVASQEPNKGGAGGEEDLSMEEILQSIRRIIAEDGTDSKNGEAPPAVSKSAQSDDVSGSDVLELTEMLKEDGTVVSLNQESPTPAPTPEPAAPAAAPADVLSRIDQALATSAPAPAPAQAAPKETPKPAALAPAAAPARDSVLSDPSAAAVSASFDKLKTVEEEPAPVVTTPSPAFRSGKTVEDMVAEMLRPMMKEWLDANLPPIVERIVEREVKRLSR